MDNRQLIYFKAVCDEGGFTKAAEKLFISPQGISKAVHKLEAELGVPLFVTTPLGVMLTDYGVALQDHVAAYLNQHNQILDHMTAMRKRLDFELNIGMQNGFSELFPPHFFPDFIAGNPDIRTSITTFFNKEDLIRNVDETHSKILFCASPYDTELYEILYEKRHKVFLIAGESHPLAKKKSVRAADLVGVPLINVSSDLGSHPKLKLNLSRVGVAPQYILSSRDRALTMELVASGLAVSFHGGDLYKKYPGIVRVEIEDFDIDFSIGVIIRKDTYQTDAIKRFIAYADNVLNKKE